MTKDQSFLSLSASAGSGKTYKLSIRYLGLLLIGAKINEILAITFTKKAASEMKNRIQKYILLLEKYIQAQNLLSEKELNEAKDIASELEHDFNLSQKDIGQNIDRIKQDFLFNSPCISTIDAIVNKILKRFCWYAGIGMSPDIIGEHDLADEFVNTIYQKDPKKLESLVKLCVANEWNLDTYLQNMDKLRIHKDLLKRDESIDIEDAQKDFVDACKDLAIKLQLEKKRKDKILYQANFDKFINNLLDEESIIKRLYIGKNDKTIDDITNKNYLEQFINKGSTYIKECMENICEKDAIISKTKEASILNSMYSFVEIYDKVKRDFILKHNQMTYEDKTERLFELFAYHKDMEFFYFRLDDRWTHMLLDEFQDTNLLQYKIFKPMIEEILSGAGQKSIQSRSFFIVGDTKQAIYRFRGGDEKIFDTLSDKEVMDKESLPYNFRSLEVPLDFINDTFKDRFSSYIPQQIKLKTQENSGGYVNVVETDKDSIKECVYEQLEDLLSNGVKPKDIAILSFKGNDLAEAMEYCISKNKNLKFNMSGSDALKEQKETELVLNLIALTKAKDDKLLQAKIKKILGYKFEYKDFDFDFIEHIKNASPSEFVYHCIQKYNLTNNAIFEIINISIESKSLEELADNLESSDKKIDNISHDGVSLLTIHKSKGLEFEHVIVFELRGDSNNSEKIMYEYDNIDIKNIHIHSKGREIIDRYYKENVYDELKSKKDKEKLNLLYVAFTRAKRSLIIIKKDEKSRMAELNLPLGKIGNIKVAQKIQSSTKEEHKIVNCPSIHYKQEFISKDESIDDVSVSLAIQNEDIKSMMRNIKFGEALHYFLESTLCYEELEVEDILNLCRNKFGFYLQNESFEDIKKIYNELNSDAKYQSLLNGKVKKTEASYIDKRNGENKISRLDLLLESKDEMIVLDYKTSTRNKDRHIEQVREYTKFLKDIYPNKTISGYIVYVKEKDKLYLVG